MDDPLPAPRRATRWGLIAGGALILVTALALLVVTLTLSGDRCEQAATLLGEAAVVGGRPPADLADALPADSPIADAVSRDDPLDADGVAQAFSDPSLGRPLLDEHGFDTGLGRAWRAPRALASVWVLTFERIGGASGFARELVVLTCERADEIFGVGGIRGAVGIRLRFDDAVQDEVIFSYGSMVGVVGYTYPGTEAPSTSASEQLARAARDSFATAAR